MHLFQWQFAFVNSGKISIESGVDVPQGDDDETPHESWEGVSPQHVAPSFKPYKIYTTALGFFLLLHSHFNLTVREFWRAKANFLSPEC